MLLDLSKSCDKMMITADVANTVTRLFHFLELGLELRLLEKSDLMKEVITDLRLEATYKKKGE